MTTSTVPGRYRNQLDDLDPCQAVTDARRWLDRFHTGDRTGLLIAGPVGTGKSTLAGALAVACGEPNWAQYWPVPDYLAAVKDSFHSDAIPITEKVHRRPVLVLDDLGADRLTDWGTDQISQLIARRYDAQLTLVVTTNLAPTQLEDLLGERIVSRLTEMTALLRITGPDRRRATA